MRKFLKYSCWAVSAVLVIAGFLQDKLHLYAIAGIWFILGTFQDEED
jgi:hypothetical protein